MPVSASRRGLVLTCSEKELKMVRTPEDVANAAERLALKNAKILNCMCNIYPNAIGVILMKKWFSQMVVGIASE